MSHHDIVRAWKDPAYRASLSPEARAHMLPHPAGMPEITDNELREAAGATNNCATKENWTGKQYFAPVSVFYYLEVVDDRFLSRMGRASIADG